MILVYTGNGKGKTSACIGQAMRALGHDMAVAFAQFMKRAGQAGEQRILATLPGLRFFAGGKGFFRQEATREEHRQAALAVLGWAQAQVHETDMLVLDEALYALGAGLVTREELEALMDVAQRRGVHVVLSGRGAPPWLVERADMVSTVEETRHHFRAGRQAAAGIEY